MEAVIHDGLRQCRLCSGLSDDSLAELAKVVSYERGAAGQILFRSGDLADRFFVLLEGHVAITFDDGPHPETIARVVHAGETFAEAAIGGEGTFGETAEALGPVLLAVIPGPILSDLLVQRFDVVLRLLGTISVQLRGLVRQISDLSMKSASQRLASHLVSFSSAKKGPVTIELPFARKILAQELGMQPETLSRAFLKLQPLGVLPLRDRNGVRIADIAALHAFCEDGLDHERT